LLLTAGQPRGVAVRLVAQTDAVDQLERTFASSGLGFLLHPDRRGHDVLQCCHMREQVEPLEHHADVSTPRGDVPFA